MKLTLVDSGLTAGGIKSRLEFVNKSGRVSKPERNGGGGRGGAKYVLFVFLGFCHFITSHN